MPNIQTNSQYVQNGDIFIAISCPNITSNIADAIKKNASLIFLERQYQNLFSAENFVYVENARLIASKLANFCYPKAPDFCIAITGTNGKSSVTHFLNQIWQHNNIKSACLGTLGFFIGNQKIEQSEFNTNQTTPDPISLHKILEYLALNGVSHIAFEASSHAIDQKRLHSVTLYAAGFTNFASDHLDYHKTQDKYFQTKIKLFEEILPRERYIVASKDCPEIYSNLQLINKNIISFGLQKDNFIVASKIVEHATKTTFDLNIGEEIFHNISTNLVGKFQILNVLCAAAFAYLTNISTSEIVAAIDMLAPLSGRLEYICSCNGGNVYVDYAHTTEGFKQCLKAMRKICLSEGRIICIFGCGGDRERLKRKEMGAAAFSLADIIIITDDNPRTEDPAAIRAEIISACPKAQEIANRKEAIQYAMRIMRKHDVLAIIGKGHEIMQIYHETILHNDKAEVLKLNMR